MERKSRIDALGAIVLILIMTALGLNQVAVKIINSGIDPILQAALRSLAAAPVIFAYCLWRKTPVLTSRSILIPGIFTGIIFAGEFALLFQAVEYTTVARASIFFYTMPFWVALAAHFLIPGEKLTPIRTVGLLLAGLGVVIALAGADDTLGSDALLGDLMALLAASGWAAIALIARTTAFSTAPPQVQLFYQLSVSTLVLFPLVFFFGSSFNDPTAFHWWLFAGQVLIVVCLGFLSWFWVLSIYPASDMASFSFLAPLFGVVFGWLILDEALTWSIILAMALVAAGIVFVNRR